MGLLGYSFPPDGRRKIVQLRICISVEGEKHKKHCLLLHTAVAQHLATLAFDDWLLRHPALPYGRVRESVALGKILNPNLMALLEHATLFEIFCV